MTEVCQVMKVMVKVNAELLLTQFFSARKGGPDKLDKGSVDHKRS